MALKPVIYKWSLNLSDLNRHHYADYSVTLALHPSETHERLVSRMLAFALNASEDLAFSKGLSAVEEPDLWVKSLDDQINLWLEVGEPAVERVKKASHSAKQVKIYSFNSKSDVWWQQDEAKFSKLDADILQFDNTDITALAKDVERSMKWFITVSEKQRFHQYQFRRARRNVAGVAGFIRTIVARAAISVKAASTKMAL